MSKPCVSPGRRKRRGADDDDDDDDDDEEDDDDGRRGKREAEGDEPPLVDIFLNPARREEIKS